MSDERKREKTSGVSFRSGSTAFFLSYLLGSSQFMPESKVVPVMTSVSGPLGEPISPVNPFFDAQFQIGQAVTPVVGDELIAARVVGSRKEIDQVTREIQAVRLNRVVATYMDIVFTKLPGFGINLYTPEEIKAIKHTAVYYPGTKSVVITVDPEQDYYVKLDTLRHEFRHAAWNAVHTVLGERSTVTCDPYFPHTAAEKAKVEEMIAKGDQRVDKLRDLLKLEESKQLSKKDAEVLAALRGKSSDDYRKNYQLSVDCFFTKEYVESIEKAGGKKLKKGTRLFLPGYGPVIVKKIKQSTDKASPGVVIDLEFADPLYAAVYIISRMREHVRVGYGVSEYLRERDAYLHGDCPQSIREHLFPELEAYTSELMSRVASMPTLYVQPIPDFRSIPEHWGDAVIAILEDTENFELHRAEYYIAWARYAVEQGNIPAAEAGLGTLIKQGYQVGEANLELARIYYGEKNYQAAAKHFKAAEQAKAEFTSADQAHYAVAKNPGRERLMAVALAAGISEEEFDSAEEHCGPSV